MPSTPSCLPPRLSFLVPRFGPQYPTTNSTATAGTTNLGGGGGGGAYQQNGGAGGSGIVIVRYPNTYTITVGAGLTSSTTTDGSDKITSFTAGSDTVSFS